jgi:hypothetical protein
VIRSVGGLTAHPPGISRPGEPARTSTQRRFLKCSPFSPFRQCSGAERECRLTCLRLGYRQGMTVPVEPTPIEPQPSRTPLLPCPSLSPSFVRRSDSAVKPQRRGPIDLSGPGLGTPTGRLPPRPENGCFEPSPIGRQTPNPRSTPWHRSSSGSAAFVGGPPIRRTVTGPAYVPRTTIPTPARIIPPIRYPVPRALRYLSGSPVCEEFGIVFFRI